MLHLGKGHNKPDSNDIILLLILCGQFAEAKHFETSTYSGNYLLGKFPGAWVLSLVDIRTNLGRYQGFMHKHNSYGWLNRRERGVSQPSVIPSFHR